jgi:hypothetical protein
VLSCIWLLDQHRHNVQACRRFQRCCLHDGLQLWQLSTHCHQQNQTLTLPHLSALPRPLSPSLSSLQVSSKGVEASASVKHGRKML